MTVDRTMANATKGKIRPRAFRALALVLLALVLPMALAACDGNGQADGSSDGSSARGHIKFGLPF